MNNQRFGFKVPRSFWNVLSFAVIASFFVPFLHAREIHIKVLKGGNGRPVADECVNISLGAWHGGDLIAPTNDQGVVVLHLENDQVRADAGSPHVCGSAALLGPKTVPEGVTAIAVAADKYADCQEWARVTPGEAPPEVFRAMPSYPIKTILESGISTANTCGKFRAEAKPGELILFVRRRSFWERMRE